MAPGCARRSVWRLSPDAFFGVWRGAGQLETAEQPDLAVIKEKTKDGEVRRRRSRRLGVEPPLVLFTAGLNSVAVCFCDAHFQ